MLLCNFVTCFHPVVVMIPSGKCWCMTIRLLDPAGAGAGARTLDGSRTLTPAREESRD